MFKAQFNKTIKLWCLIAIIIISISIALIIMLKYHLEGETKMPYKISKITIISTAKDIPSTSEENSSTIWNLDVIQVNDIYISIDKTQYAKDDDFISLVRLENFKITQSPKFGRIKIYMPNSLDGDPFNYTDDFLVQNSLQFNGSNKSNPQNLEIRSQGGWVALSFANTELGKFISNNISEEIIVNGSLITKINKLYTTQNIPQENKKPENSETPEENGNLLPNNNEEIINSPILSEEDLKFSVSFDVIIKINKIEYKGTINLDLPVENLLTKGSTTLEITDFSNVIYKR